jgi:hypothetical protein
MTQPGRFAPALLALAVLGIGLVATLHLEWDDAADGATAEVARRPMEAPALPGAMPAVADPTDAWVAASWRGHCSTRGAVPRSMAAVLPGKRCHA